MLLQPWGDLLLWTEPPGYQVAAVAWAGVGGVSLGSPAFLNWPLLAKASFHTARNTLGSICCLGLQEAG